MPDENEYFGRSTPPEEPVGPSGGLDDDAVSPLLHGDDLPARPDTQRLTTWAITGAILFPVLLSIALIRWAGVGQAPEPAAQAQAGAIVAVDGGAFSLWASNDDGSAVRWNPCEPIRWVFNPSGAPLGAVPELQKAMDRITEVSGITFDYLGETHELPARNRSPWLPDTYAPEHWAPVLIAWRTPESTDAPLGEHDRAVAIPVAVGTSKDRVFVTAQVIFNEDLAGTPGFTDRRRSIGITMLHELLHVIGLGHVDDTSEIMFPFPVAGNADFGTGDLAGMGAVGADHGCLEVPEPEDIEVTYAS